MNAIERLNEGVLKKGPLLAELDPKIERVLALYEKEVRAKDLFYSYSINPDKCDDQVKQLVLRQYCFEFIDAVKETLTAIKVNIKTFRDAGMESTFWEAVSYAKLNNLFVIVESKSSDDEKMSLKDAFRFLYKESEVDAIVVNPYSNPKVLARLIDRAINSDKGIFIVIKSKYDTTSTEKEKYNMSFTTELDLEDMYQEVKQWGRYCSIWTTEKNKYPIVAAMITSIPVRKKMQEIRNALKEIFIVVAEAERNSELKLWVTEDFSGTLVSSSKLMFPKDIHPWSLYSRMDWDKATEYEANREKNALLEENKKMLPMYQKFF